MTLNCAAVPAELIESELFGHEKGSFTGASGRHIGKFEQADQGTIFLDEIGDMPLNMQAKLLRVLEEGEVERIGGDKPITVNVRVVVATHRDLEARVREEKFRQDLFHRIYVFPLVLPPLRERRDDIPALVEHFAAQVCAQNGWKPVPFAAEAIGGVAVASLAGKCSRIAQHGGAADAAGDRGSGGSGRLCRWRCRRLLGLGVGAAPVAIGSGALADRVQSFEREVILAELKRSHQNMSLAAKTLGLERSHLYKKAEQLGIDLRAMRREQEPQRLTRVSAGSTSPLLAKNARNGAPDAQLAATSEIALWRRHCSESCFFSSFSLLFHIFASEPPSPAVYGVRMEQAWIPMKDGVRLAATFYMPDGAKAGEKFPALLEYLPYRKDDGTAAGDYPKHAYFARRGYVGVRVDIRGFGASEGVPPEREYSEQEQVDGEQVIAWLAHQPWSNGNVGMFGISWGGFTAMQMAMRHPPALKAIVAVHATAELFHDDVHYIDGMAHVDEFELNMDMAEGWVGAPDYSLDEKVSGAALRFAALVAALFEASA